MFYIYGAWGFQHVYATVCVSVTLPSTFVASPQAAGNRWTIVSHETGNMLQKTAAIILVVFVFVLFFFSRMLCANWNSIFSKLTYCDHGDVRLTFVCVILLYTVRATGRPHLLLT